MCYFSPHQSIYLSCLSACLSACLPTCLPACLFACLPACLPAGRPTYLPVYSICLFDLLIQPVYSICLFNPPIQSTSYNKYARRCSFLTYQSSIYPAFLSNLSILSACPICLSSLFIQSAFYN